MVKPKQSLKGVTLVETLTREIKHAMRVRRMSLSDLARCTNSSRPHIYRVLSGEHSPTADWIEKVTGALGIQVIVEGIKDSGDDRMTMTEAARKMGISRQRMHQLVEQHGLETERVHSKLRLISPSELKKIPTTGKK